MICRHIRTWKVLLALIDFRSSEQDTRIYKSVFDRVKDAATNTETMCIPFEDHDLKRTNQMLTKGIAADRE